MILEIIDNFAMVPGGIATFIIGLVYGFFTGYGFFKYKWLIVKWALTIYLILTGAFILKPLLYHNINIALKMRDSAVFNITFQKNLFLQHIFGLCC